MKGLLRKSGLTRNESLIIGFLIIAFITGIIIKYSSWKKQEDHDYSSSDKKFDEQVKTAFSELEKNKLSTQQQKKNELDRFADSLISAKDNAPRSDSLKIERKKKITAA